MEPSGDWTPNPQSPRHGQKEEEMRLCRLVEVLDLEDGLRLGPMWVWEEEDCPDAGHMVRIGVHFIPTQIRSVHIPIPFGGIGTLMEWTIPITLNFIPNIHKQWVHGRAMMNLL
mgnify:CR=1 FL=1